MVKGLGVSVVLGIGVEIPRCDMGKDYEPFSYIDPVKPPGTTAA